MKKIVLTGGGTAGHVTPNLALIPKLMGKGWEIAYIGSEAGIEKNLVQGLDIPYYAISSGKLRRYFDLKNIRDPFKVVKGLLQSYFLLRKLKPDVIFSKGGFVSVPVVIAGWLNKIPVLIHESDITPGLANRISTKFASKIFVSFEEAARHLPNDKTIHTGSPIREELLRGDKQKGLQLLGFTNKHPVITVIGGSLGSVRLNTLIREALPEVGKQFQVVHICGKGNTDPACDLVGGYKQFEYVSDELADVFAATDLVISRAGSNAIFELLMLQKPMILVPLPKSASRGDQILNAQAFQKKGFCHVLHEEELDANVLIQAIAEVYSKKTEYLQSMQKYSTKNSLEELIHYIEDVR